MTTRLDHFKGTDKTPNIQRREETGIVAPKRAIADGDTGSLLDTVEREDDYERLNKFQLWKLRIDQ